MKGITVPDIGDFRDVPIIEILVAVGDTVVRDQPLAVVESDKATVEIPSPEAGVVEAIEARVGEKVSKGSRLISLRISDGEAAAAGSQIPIAPVGQHGAKEEASAREAAATERTSAGSVAPLPTAGASRASCERATRVYAGPAVRKMARDLGVCLQEIRGSGPRGRIVAQDVRAHMKSAMKSLAENPSTESGAGTHSTALLPFALPPLPKVDFAAFGPVESQPLSRIRRISGANLHRNWVTIPHVTNHEDADVTDLEGFRAELNQENGPLGTKISPLPFIMKACVATLKEYPQFNASLDAGALILKRYYHVGFAVDTPDGLVVPVIRNVDLKNIVQLAREMTELAARARAGKLSIAEMQGGSFSISSLGGIGGSYFTPIINAPEVAILGVGKIQTRVVWATGRPQSRLLLPLSLSWDHRVIDGAAAGRFNACLARVLRDVRRLLL